MPQKKRGGMYLLYKNPMAAFLICGGISFKAFDF